MEYKKIIALIICIAPLLLFSGNVFAVNLSQDYPEIGGVSPEAGAIFFVYAYNVCVAVGAFLGVAMLIKEGLRIITAGENAGKVSDAKQRFGSIAFGTGVLLSSYVLLSAINPELLQIKLPEFPEIKIPGEFTPNSNDNKPDVLYTEVPVGAIIESILNSVSTSVSQAYNYSSVDVDNGHTEERCYLYDEYGNAIDKNKDGYITDLDEYQGLDFSICINELLKATEHKLLYLNGDKYRCGTPGYSDEDSPKGKDGSPGKTDLGINYHDWDEAGSNNCEYTEYSGSSECTNDGEEGIINKLKKYIRDGCVCENCELAAIGGTSPLTDFYCKGGSIYCDVWCSSKGDGTHGPGSKCCGGPRGRDQNCQNRPFNHIYDKTNPYILHDPCTTRKSIDCMRKFINTIVYGDKQKDKEQREVGCPPQEAAPSPPLKTDFECSGFSENDDPEVAGGAEVMSLKMAWERLVSFRTYFEKRLSDLTYAEKYLMNDKRLEVYSRAEIQKIQQESKEIYKFSQSRLSLSKTYDTVAYRRKFYCSQYEDTINLAKKNVYEDDADRRQDFTGNWGSEGIDAMYINAQKNNHLIRIKTGDFISNLHVDGSMEIKGKNYYDLTEEERNSMMCAKGGLLDVGSKDPKQSYFYDIDKKCTGGGSGNIVALTPTIDEKRVVAWNDKLYEKGGFSYLDENNKEYYTGEEMATNGDPMTFYVLEDPNLKVDPFYTGRDQMPYYFQKGFIDFSQFAENSAIDTEVVAARESLLPSLIPVGQLSYHTKIYARQMIRTLNRTIEQVEASILTLDNLANDYVEGNTPRTDGKGVDGLGCDCQNCSNRSDCHCVAYDTEGNCIYWDCSNTCSTCKTSKSSICSSCSSVDRYKLFVAGKYTQKNKEIFVENIITDKLPNSIKFIVKGMSCPERKRTCEETSVKVSDTIHTSAEKFTYKYDEKDLYAIYLNDGNPIILDWDGVTPVSLSGSPKAQNNEVGFDDSVLVINETNGREKFFLGDDHNKVWVGDLTITEILDPGKNSLKFIALDTCGIDHISSGDCIGVDELYLYYCPEKYASNGCTGEKTYSPPAGFEIAECNAWNSNLKEERPCTDYNGDIVVYLKPKGTIDR
ncbi:MAG: hypothetical protein WCX74_03165 [Candidatus Paceibacterota bacterium]